MQTITSRDNAKLKAVRALVRSRKQREKERCFVMEGIRSLRALADATVRPEYRLKELWISDRAAPAMLSSVQKEAVQGFQIPHELMEQISDCRTSQGILGVVEVSPVELAIGSARGRYLLLDGLSDPGNMGTLIRSSAAFGWDGILLYGNCVEILNPKTMRSTMGALPFSSVWTVDDAVFDTLEQLDYELVATVLRDGENLYETTFSPRTVLVVGSEARGVSPDILRRAPRKISIPMSGNTESLNAGVAGSICMSAIKNHL
jgi:TrmH family RNA methyltransferase